MKTHIKKLIGASLLALVLLTADSTVATLNYSSHSAAGSGFQGDAIVDVNNGWTWGAYGSGTAQLVGKRSRGFRSGAWETIEDVAPASVTYLIAEMYWGQGDGWTLGYSKVYRDGDPNTTYGRGDVWE